MEQVDIKGFEDYQITDDGRVWSKKNNIWMKPSTNAYGYYFLNLTKNGKKYQKFIHRLVVEAFIPNLEKKPCVDHINTLKTDNRSCNLRWCTHKENSNNPLTKQKMSISQKGNTNAKKNN